MLVVTIKITTKLDKKEDAEKLGSDIGMEIFFGKHHVDIKEVETHTEEGT